MLTKQKEKKKRILLKSLTPARILVAYYFLAVTVSVILLSLPIALKPGVKLSFIDTVFTAVSAVSVTGLTVVSTSDTFSTTGIFILAFVLQFGGIGIMTLGAFFWLLLGKKIGLKERRLIMADQNQVSLAGLVKLMRQILILILGIELVGFLILGTYYLNYFPTWQEAYLQGFFAAISATTNGGFDITGASLVPFAKDYFVQFITILLIILGAIGFPVLIEVKEFLISPANRRYRFSLYTKLTSITFFALLIVGTVMILLLENNHFFNDKTWHESFFYALFQSSSTKSSGLTTMEVSQFTQPTLLLLSGLMFVGASPSSAGGGIRTTTLAISILFLYHFARGRKTVKIFNRELHEDDITKSLVVIIMAVILCFSSIFILMITEPFSLMQILYEVCSAFGTTGSSMGITAELSTIGKMLIIVLMFIGRIGIPIFLYIISKKGKDPEYHFPKERVIIG